MAVMDGITPFELKELQALAEARKPAFTPFVGSKRLLLPGVDDLNGSSWEPRTYAETYTKSPRHLMPEQAVLQIREVTIVVQGRTLREFALQCRQSLGYNGDSTGLLGFLYFIGNPREFPWGLTQRLELKRIFFPLAELAHPNGDTVSPYLILQEGRRLSWNVLSLDGTPLDDGDGVLCNPDEIPTY